MNFKFCTKNFKYSFININILNFYYIKNIIKLWIKDIIIQVNIEVHHLDHRQDLVVIKSISVKIIENVNKRNILDHQAQVLLFQIEIRRSLYNIILGIIIVRNKSQFKNNTFLK